MHTNQPYDIAIVGARIAGASTALLLARAGLRTLLIDRSELGADTVSTHALMRGGVVQLQRWGVLDAITSAGTPPIRNVSFHYRSRRIDVPIKGAHGVDALYAPRRTILDRALVEAARAAGADVGFDTSVVDLVRESDGRVRGLVVRDHGGTSRTIAADLVIGADGRGSTVAHRVDAPVSYVGAHVTSVLYGYWEGLEANGYEWVFTPGAGAGLIPTNDGRVCVFAGAPRGTIGHGGLRELRTVVRGASSDVADRLAAAKAPASVRAFTGPPSYLRRPWGDGWALVGDAGAWRDPISAHGMTDALRDAELLARAVIAAARGEAPLAASLAAYERARDRVALPVMKITDRMASLAWTEDEIMQLHRSLSEAMSDEVAMLLGLEEVAAR